MQRSANLQVTRFAALRDAGVLTGRLRKNDSLRSLCHRGQLRGGLSIGLVVTPDEAFGALCHAMGGRVERLRLADVRRGPPMQLDVFEGDFRESWEVEDVPALLKNLNSLQRERGGGKTMARLGDFEDMLQVVALEDDLIRAFNLEAF